MKHIIILGDGMADWHCPELDGKTLLQHASTPTMDRLAKAGRTGMLKTVPEGFHPGSEVANSSILGYDQSLVYEGRGPLEAASIGVELAEDDMAIRCNLVCIEGDTLKNHSCGRLETEEGDVLMKYLNETLAKDDEIAERFGEGRIAFYTGVQYRHLLVIKGGSKHVMCTPPHDIPLQPWRPNLPCAEETDEQRSKDMLSAEETAELIRMLIIKSQTLLDSHPLNAERRAKGMDPANSIWPWAGGYRPRMQKLTERFPFVKRGSVITAVDLIRGIGLYAGLKCIDVEGATGLYDTNYEGKAEAAIEALLNGDDFVYVHVEASDEAGHDGDMQLKLQTIENLDSRLISRIVEVTEQFGKPGTQYENEEPVAIAVLPDHPTPVAHRTHTNAPIPFLIYAPGIEADNVETFDEDACLNGAYGVLEKDDFIKTFMAIG